ncbi:MAG: class I SAM-dependent methyltransferase [Gammaproteobacteria bacterium]|nr:class I SAM-dependent methyltransferase [Gammaproteobacteria bacterium]MBU1722383.1 class I SAM-dependent methyltransferase [Gammaproteobacteria bacterium]MBU2004680.1 class I SAM-dependent methyltransferase [Gammaproteobacteria bacterium]
MNKAEHNLPLHDNHSHSQIARRVPLYAHVLELGCGVGNMSKLLKEHCEATIIGVDSDPRTAWQASCFCDYVFTQDLDDPHSLDALEFEKFDAITLVDVLEHLKDPVGLLQRLKPLLLDEGQLLLSVPNVAHASVRLELLGGNFQYENSGILDTTHLKFFTANSLQALLQEAGYAVQVLEYTWHDLADTVISEGLQAAGLPVTPEALAAFHTPEAMAYQFIVVAQPVQESARESASLPLKPLQSSQDTWAGLQSDLAQARQELANMQAELQRVYATRSWQVLRRGASAWRDIQSRFTAD